ncbi:MAG: HAD family hydrolase, partial [Planctomycetota bacterium]
GVLVDSYAAWNAVVNELRTIFDLPHLTPQEFDAGWGQGLDADLKTWFRGRTREEVARLYDERFVHHLQAITTMPGARELLDALVAEDLRLACVTNTRDYLARQILEDHELAGFFEVVLGGDQVPRPKPAPDLLLAALRALDCPASDAFFVGDTGNDAAAASAAGVRLIGFRQKAGIQVSELHQILAVVTGSHS